MKYDFGGYATKNDLRCSDGRVIRRDAFKDNDGQTVPLVWQHLHNDPTNVLGHAMLQNRSDGVYAFCTLNDTPAGEQARELVKHGDVTSLSIYANKLVQDGSSVLHGAIREVSLVLAGANPGAYIDNLNFAHSDGSVTEAEDEAIIGVDAGIELAHADNGSTDSNNQGKKEDNMANENAPQNGGQTIQDVIDGMTEEQKNVLYFLVGQAMEDQDTEVDVDVDEEMAQSAFYDDDEEDYMYHNVFEGGDELSHAEELIHADFSDIITDARRVGSFKDALLMHAQEYGIENIDVLFPDARAVNSTPNFIKRRTEWVASVLNGSSHTPFSRIKSTAANITADEARAKGYIKGKKKKDEVIKALKRTTSPTTIYKKQRLDRDDILDITDFDVVQFLRGEMRLMLDEELARAVLVGDGRTASDDDHISEDSIRPIWTDDDLYAPKVLAEASATTEDIMDSILVAMDDYEGSGSPTLFISQSDLTSMLLLKDKIGRRLYNTKAEVAEALGVGDIVPVPIMKGLTRTVNSNTHELFAIIVNMKDYTIGADKGGEVNTFDDFDIDYNQQKYLIETRCSGALTVPKSAVVVEKLKAKPSGSSGQGSSVTPTV